MFKFNKVLPNKFDSNNLKSNLAFLIKKYNLDNETLAKCTGVAAATLATLRSRSSNPTIATLQSLAEFFDLTVDQLINQDCSSMSNQPEEKLKKSITIPIINISLAENWPFDWHSHSAHFPVSSITTNNDLNSLCYAVRLNTEVLAPYYQKNTVLILDPHKETQDSNIVLVGLNNSEPSFRQIFLDSGQYYFKPINPEFGMMQASNEFKILGVVVRAIYDHVTSERNIF